MAEFLLEQAELYELENPGQIDGDVEQERYMAKVKRMLPRGTAKKKDRTEAVGGIEVSLPTERSRPLTRLHDYSILMFGEKKIGKTDLSAQFPDTIHLMFEPGGKAQEIFQRPVHTWREFKGYVRLLKKDRRFANVAVDTVDLAYTRCFEYMMQKLGIEHPSDEAYGKGWSAIRQEFGTEMATLMSIGKGVLFISHATEKEIKMRSGDKYEKIMPTLAGQGRDVVEGMVDLWFYYGYDGRDRVLTITGNDHIGAGHRLKKNFRYPDGSPVHEIPMGANAEEAYANLIAAFNNKLTGTSRRDVTSVTKKMVVKKKGR